MVVPAMVEPAVGRMAVVGPAGLHVIDAHCHADSQGFVALQCAHGVMAVVNAQSPQEFERVRGWGAPCVSFGVHPWDAGTLMDGTFGAALAAVAAPDDGPRVNAGLFAGVADAGVDDGAGVVAGAGAGLVAGAGAGAGSVAGAGAGAGVDHGLGVAAGADVTAGLTADAGLPAGSGSDIAAAHAGMAAGMPVSAVDTGADPSTAHALELLRPLMPWYRQADAVGEIGLDREWTDGPLAAQLPVFRAQLRIAAALGKPVILHTKGAEREVLEELRALRDRAGSGVLDSPCAQSHDRSRTRSRVHPAHPAHPRPHVQSSGRFHHCPRLRAPRIMVHWYDCDDWVDEYIALGCWMTLGPDWSRHQAMRALAAATPIDRLLIESDGLESIAWACPKVCPEPCPEVCSEVCSAACSEVRPEEAAEPSVKAPLSAYLPTLNHSLAALADLRGMPAPALAERLRANLRSFMTGKVAG